MNRVAIGVLFAIFVSLVSGCGGGGSNSVAAVASPFAGTWAGTWNQPSSGQQGTVSVVIGNDGRFSGSAFNNTLGAQTTSLVGSINSSGQFSVTYQYAGTNPIAGRGTATFDNTGHIIFVFD